MGFLPSPLSVRREVIEHGSRSCVDDLEFFRLHCAYVGHPIQIGFKDAKGIAAFGRPRLNMNGITSDCRKRQLKKNVLGNGAYCEARITGRYGRSACRDGQQYQPSKTYSQIRETTGHQTSTVSDTVRRLREASQELVKNFKTGLN